MADNALSIQIQNLGKRFNREWIFRRLDFTFLPSNTYAITGPNGSGKSTLMQVLWGQSLPSSGTLKYVVNNNVIEETEIFRHVAVATPYMDLIEEFTLAEQVRFHFSMKKLRDGITEEQLIDEMYLTASRHKQIGNFSSGMRQRLKLGLAFYTECDVLFLDEPGTNLDSKAFDWYLHQLGMVSGHRLVFVASNNREEYRSATQEIDIMDYK
jgi:ABC-type multidrug transport system ATPase subunit